MFRNILYSNNYLSALCNYNNEMNVLKIVHQSFIGHTCTCAFTHESHVQCRLTHILFLLISGMCSSAKDCECMLPCAWQAVFNKGRNMNDSERAVQKTGNYLFLRLL